MTSGPSSRQRWRIIPTDNSRWVTVSSPTHNSLSLMVIILYKIRQGKKTLNKVQLINGHLKNNKSVYLDIVLSKSKQALQIKHHRTESKIEGLIKLLIKTLFWRKHRSNTQSFTSVKLFKIHRSLNPSLTFLSLMLYNVNVINNILSNKRWWYKNVNKNLKPSNHYNMPD